MPTYSYTCDACNHAMEAFQKINDGPLKTCPECQQKTLRRGIGGGLSTFRFQGSGFYITDYQTKKGSQSEPAAVASSSSCGCGKNVCEK